MLFERMQLEIESTEEQPRDAIALSMAESFLAVPMFSELGVDLTSLRLNYGNHRGGEGLRQLIAEQAGSAIDASNVLVTAGAAGALFAVTASLIEPGDHMVVVRPNYSNNIETPRVLRADVTYLDLEFDKQFRLELDDVKAALRPKTKVVSLTTPHNPSGVIVDRELLAELAQLAEAKGFRLLVDETYRDLSMSVADCTAALSPNVISVSSMSKSYGLPGLRIGWIICRDGLLLERFLAAKEQIALTGSVIDEEVAFQVLQQRSKIRAEIVRDVPVRLRVMKEWMASQGALRWVEPAAGVVCFPRIEDEQVEPADFYRILLEERGMVVGPGRWFDRDDRYMRLGFGHLPLQRLHEGLSNIDFALAKAGRRT